jgi:hypothetical protein
MLKIRENKDGVQFRPERVRRGAAVSQILASQRQTLMKTSRNEGANNNANLENRGNRETSETSES